MKEKGEQLSEIDRLSKSVVNKLSLRGEKKMKEGLLL